MSRHAIFLKMLSTSLLACDPIGPIWIGKGYYVQTLNRRFSIEPHLLAPFIHFLPRAFQERLLQNFTLWGLVTRPSEKQCDSFLQEVRLLDEREMK